MSSVLCRTCLLDFWCCLNKWSKIAPYSSWIRCISLMCSATFSMPISASIKCWCSSEFGSVRFCNNNFGPSLIIETQQHAARQESSVRADRRSYFYRIPTLTAWSKSFIRTDERISIYVIFDQNYWTSCLCSREKRSKVGLPPPHREEEYVYTMLCSMGEKT